MTDLLLPLKKKINHLINNLIITGATLLILGVFIVWTDIILRLIVGFVVVMISYIFFYIAYHLIFFKKELDKLNKR